jgi:hypothetical protein
MGRPKRRNAVATNAPFGDVLEAADQLTPDEQEQLVAILRRRLAERGRKRVAGEVEESRQEFSRGGCQAVTPDDLMTELLS